MADEDPPEWRYSRFLCLSTSQLDYIEFFISRRADITSTGLVLPVTFWISGSCNCVSIRQEGTKGRTYMDTHEHVVELDRALVCESFVEVDV